LSVKRTSIAQALSQAAGHSFSRPASAQVQSDEPPIGVESRPTLLRAVVPSRVGKKPVTGFFDPAVSRQIKKLGLDRDRTMQEILQEALNDLFRKYDLPPIA
jgi:hypothetical protein